jgi:hypothetical protein
MMTNASVYVVLLNWNGLADTLECFGSESYCSKDLTTAGATTSITSCTFACYLGATSVITCRQRGPLIGSTRVATQLWSRLEELSAGIQEYVLAQLG